MSEKSKVDSFYKFLISNGYYFDKELIENYLLSLKVKPFVILTGNSGTGKTKLSQLFAKFCETRYHMIKVTTKGTSWGYSEKKDEKGKDCGWSIISEYMEDILPYNMRGTYEIEVGGHVSTAEITISPYLSYDKHNDTFKEYFEELYWIEQNQIKEENKMGISHKDQLVDLGISYDPLSSSISNDEMDYEIDKRDSLEEKEYRFKDGDIYKMHTYKDSILKTEGAYVLYPGNITKKFKETNLIIPSVGAFSLTPGNNDVDEDNLEVFVKEVLRTLLFNQGFISYEWNS